MIETLRFLCLNECRRSTSGPPDGVIKKCLCNEREIHIHYVAIDDLVMITTPLKKRYKRPLVMLWTTPPPPPFFVFFFYSLIAFDERVTFGFSKDSGYTYTSGTAVPITWSLPKTPAPAITWSPPKTPAPAWKTPPYVHGLSTSSTDSAPALQW